MYETVNARVWSRASKYQTMRTRVAAPLDAERPRPPLLERRVVAPRVRDGALDDEWIEERLAFAERDVAVPEVEVARERDLELLAHADRAVRLHLDADVGGKQRVTVSRSCGRNGEGCRRGESRDR